MSDLERMKRAGDWRGVFDWHRRRNEHAEALAAALELGDLERFRVQTAQPLPASRAVELRFPDGAARAELYAKYPPTSPRALTMLEFAQRVTYHFGTPEVYGEVALTAPVEMELLWDEARAKRFWCDALIGAWPAVVRRYTGYVALDASTPELLGLWSRGEADESTVREHVRQIERALEEHLYATTTAHPVLNIRPGTEWGIEYLSIQGLRSIISDLCFHVVMDTCRASTADYNDGVAGLGIDLNSRLSTRQSLWTRYARERLLARFERNTLERLLACFTLPLEAIPAKPPSIDVTLLEPILDLIGPVDDLLLGNLTSTSDTELMREHIHATLVEHRLEVPEWIRLSHEELRALHLARTEEARKREAQSNEESTRALEALKSKLGFDPSSTAPTTSSTADYEAMFGSGVDWEDF